MALRFYDTLERSLREFEPLEPGRVRIYACGPTVYREPHVGNFRTFLFNDLLHRYLEWKGFDVTLVMNLTDVDDRTIAGAAEKGVPLEEHTAPIIEGFHRTLEVLGMRPADAYPRATRHIPQMVELVAALERRGHAYSAEDGSVYFDISSFPSYGRLSRVDLSTVRQGERVAGDTTDKADVRDFALWKAARPEDREVGAVWETPWGEGRPGWHLECSAMSMAELGQTFDIHTGGEDLVFPHHEDEIAQSEGATGQPFVRYWLHVKHLLLDSAKMSKSLGNFFTVDDLIERGHPASAIRYLLLSAHYRKELNFSLEGLDDARAAVRRLSDFADRLEATPTAEDAPPAGLEPLARKALEAFEAALDDDLNSPAALGALFTFVRETNAALDRHDAVATADLAAAHEALRRIDAVLGLLELAGAAAATDDQEFAAWVEQRLEDRRKARESRDFAAADAIRDELAEAGVVVEDTPRGPRWKRSG